MLAWATLKRCPVPSQKPLGVALLEAASVVTVECLGRVSPDWEAQANRQGVAAPSPVT